MLRIKGLLVRTVSRRLCPKWLSSPVDWRRDRWPARSGTAELPVIAPAVDQALKGLIDMLIETGTNSAIIERKSFPGRFELWEEWAVSHGPQLAAYAGALKQSSDDAALNCRSICRSSRAVSPRSRRRVRHKDRLLGFVQAPFGGFAHGWRQSLQDRQFVFMIFRGVIDPEGWTNHGGRSIMPWI
ncbi:hypothetical protein ACVITL_006953 [Rhizobium pisi]